MMSRNASYQNFAGNPHSAYYRCPNRNVSMNEKFNQKLCRLIKEVHEEKNGILGYGQMTVK